MIRPIDDKKVRQKLIAAHNRDKEKIKIDPEWHQQVMQTIRKIGPLERDEPFMSTFQELVWRLAPAAGILLVALGVGLFTLNASFESGITETFVNDPIAAVFSSMLWG